MFASARGRPTSWVVHYSLHYFCRQKDLHSRESELCQTQLDHTNLGCFKGRNAANWSTLLYVALVEHTAQPVLARMIPWTAFRAVKGINCAKPHDATSPVCPYFRRDNHICWMCFLVFPMSYSEACMDNGENKGCSRRSLADLLGPCASLLEFPSR